MVFVYIIYTSKLQQGNRVIIQKLHTCTKIKNKTKGKRQYIINKQLTPLPLKKQKKKKTTKQNGICTLKFAHKSDLTITALR